MGLRYAIYPITYEVGFWYTIVLLIYNLDLLLKFRNLEKQFGRSTEKNDFFTFILLSLSLSLSLCVCVCVSVSL